MSARSYLSIGDVLTLLRQEFPDVTISKIRFLESQGLVNPERTPSGYRKFYEHDVERLRWVLRQQREHFLPLKVIKDRLDDDATGAEAGVGAGVGAGATKAATRKSTTAAAAASAPSAASAPGMVVGEPGPASSVPGPVVAEPEPADPSVGTTVTERDPAEPVLVGHRASGAPRAARSAPSSAGAAPGVPGAHAGTALAATPTPPAVAPADRASRAATESSSRSATTAPGGGNGSGARRGAGGASSPPGAPATRPARRSAGPEPTPAPAATAPAVIPPAQSTPPSAAPAPATDVPAPPSLAMGGMGGASLSLDELCAASGLRAEYVGELQEYGLLHATVVGGAEYFDEESLTVANVAAKFAAYGIEARHLRLYKNAAEREAGFIEQVVIPMVRQRNPEARARATQTADELAGLGQQLRGSLLRTALRDLLQG